MICITFLLLPQRLYTNFAILRTFFSLASLFLNIDSIKKDGCKNQPNTIDSYFPNKNSLYIVSHAVFAAALCG